MIDRRNKKLKSAALLLLFILTLGSCLSSATKKHPKIGFSQCCKAPWRTVMENEMKRELSFYPDAELLIKTAEDNSNTQMGQIKELVASGIDILMIGYL